MHGHTWGTPGPQEANKSPKGAQKDNEEKMIIKEQLGPKSDMRGAEERPLQPKSPIKVPKQAQKRKLERGLETKNQKGSFPDPSKQPKSRSCGGGSSILTLARDGILDPFWEAFWSILRFKNRSEFAVVFRPNFLGPEPGATRMQRDFDGAPSSPRARPFSRAERSYNDPRNANTEATRPGPEARRIFLNYE